MSIEPTKSKRLNKEQWQALLSERRDSSMTQSEFCRSKGLCLATFYNWRRKLSSFNSITDDTKPEWIELNKQK